MESTKKAKVALSSEKMRVSSEELFDIISFWDRMKPIKSQSLHEGFRPRSSSLHIVKCIKIICVTEEEQGRKTELAKEKLTKLGKQKEKHRYGANNSSHQNKHITLTKIHYRY